MLASDLLALTHPLRPWALVQARIARLEPDRARVIAGEPASLGELRRRFIDETGGDDDFTTFVRRQAILAAGRAERAVIGDRYKVPRLVAEQITCLGRFRDEVAALAARLERPFEDVLADARSCLDELVTVQSPVAIDLFRFVLGPMHVRAWTVQTDVESLERLRDTTARARLSSFPAIAHMSTRWCSGRFCTATTSLATTCSAATTCRSSRSARWAGAPA